MSDFITAAKALAPVIAAVIALTTFALALLIADTRDRRNPFAMRPDVQADRDAHQKRAWGEQR